MRDSWLSWAPPIRFACNSMDAACIITCGGRLSVMQQKPQGSLCLFESDMSSSEGVKAEAPLMLVHIVDAIPHRGVMGGIENL